VAYVDDQLGRLLAGLDRLGLADRTVVIVTADHGEALGDHGSLLHETVYDEVARVPLIIRVPDGVRGRRVAEVVGLVDLVPTVLELVGAAAAEVVEGESLAAELRGAAWPGGGTALTVGRGSPRLAGLRRERFKYVESREVGLRPHGGAVRREELYDLAADPVEAVDLVAEEARHGELADLRTRLAELKARAERIHQRHHQAGPADHEVAVPREEQERLRALGYVD
jgi:choline-sulfatase